MRPLLARFRRLLSAAATTAPPRLSWGNPDAAPDHMMSCPNCGANGRKPQVLTLAFQPVGYHLQHWTLLECSDCRCRFYAEQVTAEYGDEAMLGRGRSALYLQQGAGISQLVRPLARVCRPAGSVYLDVGCGVGFALDFARRSKGWQGLGIDPAQMAAIGRGALGLPIEQRLLGDDEPDLAGQCDVVMAAETIEHVPSPAAFLNTLKATLKPGGVLILTTPNADAVRPDASPGQITGILSPGLHLVLQTQASLEAILHRTGFAHVEIETDGGALVAYASTEILVMSDTPAAQRLLLRAYLEDRSQDFTPAEDLFWGFAGRGLLEAVNDGDHPRATRLRRRLHAGCLERFGIDLDRIDTLPAKAGGVGLEAMVACMPLNLANILYADAMLALYDGAVRPSLERKFMCAAEAAAQLRRATGELGMEDAMSEDIGWVASAEAIICAAAANKTDTVKRLERLPVAPGPGGAARRREMAGRVLVTLVNAGAYTSARALARRMPEMDSGHSRDERFCRAILALQPGGDAAAARSGFAAVRESLAGDAQGRPSELYWAALRGEIQALQQLGHARMAADLCRDVATFWGSQGADMPADLVTLLVH